MKQRLRGSHLHTVCEEARCPNIGECFQRRTATFLLMGKRCTRSCGFCAVEQGAPFPLDADEPERVAQKVAELGLKHAVITSVTRDDLSDGGAAHFVRTVEALRRLCPATTVELLVPDFEGREPDIKTICDSRPEVFNHNLETVERLTPGVRDLASYRRSLSVLEIAKKTSSSSVYLKSGIMVGLGERQAEVVQTLRDLNSVGCDIVTIGQYLRPSRQALPVAEYLEPERFEEYQVIGEEIGLKYLFSGPLVRSSYLADQALGTIQKRRG